MDSNEKLKENLLRVSFLLGEHSSELEELYERFDELNKQINYGPRSLVVRVTLTEDEVKRLVDLVKTDQKLITEKDYKQAEKKGKILVITGGVLAAAVGNIQEIIEAAA